jgi:AraC family transcriptional regulator, glycine betaine-responsive activator
MIAMARISPDPNANTARPKARRAIAVSAASPAPVAPMAASSAPETIGFFLVPNFSMIAFTSAIEPLRLANRVSRRELYQWRLFSTDGEAVRASNGVDIKVQGACCDAKALTSVVVCAGLEVHALPHRPMIAALRRLASFGTAVGAVCTGTYVLAKAGLLTGHHATIHWENRDGLLAEFPDLEISQELFELDRNRFTCAGGTAAVDMMLSIIARDHGPDIASEVTDQLIHHRIREASERQRMDLRSRIGVAHPKLLSVVALMEHTIESPLGCDALASHVQISVRQLERLFAKYLGQSPSRYYVALRLQRARVLLQQTSDAILDIALAAGFVSASHFSKSYHEHFGRTPSAERSSRRIAWPLEQNI